MIDIGTEKQTCSSSALILFRNSKICDDKFCGDEKPSHLKFCTLRGDDESLEGSTVTSRFSVAPARSLLHHRCHHRTRTLFLEGLHAPALCNTIARQSFGIPYNLSHLSCLCYVTKTVLSRNQAMFSASVRRKAKFRQSFHFQFF